MIPFAFIGWGDVACFVILVLIFRVIIAGYRKVQNR